MLGRERVYLTHNPLGDLVCRSTHPPAWSRDRSLSRWTMAATPDGEPRRARWERCGKIAETVVWDDRRLEMAQRAAICHNEITSTTEAGGARVIAACRVVCGRSVGDAPGDSHSDVAESGRAQLAGQWVLSADHQMYPGMPACLGEPCE